MTKVLQKVVRSAALLLGCSTASVALAVATVEVTYNGPQAKINETTIRLVESNGSEVKPDPDNRNRFVVLPGPVYMVRVYRADGTQVGQGQGLSFADGNSQLVVDVETGALSLIPPAAVAASTPAMFDFMTGVKPGGFLISAGGGVVKDTAPTIGVNGVTGSPLLEGPSKIYTANVDGSFNLIKDGRPGCRWDAGGSWGQRSTSDTVPKGTSAGYAFWEPQVFTGSTGGTSSSQGVLSSQGWDTHIKSNFWEFHLDGATRYSLWESAPWRFGAEPLIGYQHYDYKYDGSIVNQTLPGLSSDTNQTIREDNFRVGYALWKRYAFAGGGWAEGLLGFDGIYYHSRYSGTQKNLCSFCRPPLLTEYNLSTNDSKSGGTWGVRFQETLGFPIGRNAELRLSATYQYRDKSPIIVNDVLPTDPSPHLSTHSRQFGNLQAAFYSTF